MPVRFTQHLALGASHVLEGHKTCGKLHGHLYHVSLTFEGEPYRDNWGYPMSEKTLAGAIGIVNELKLRHLNDMIPAGTPSVNGIAAYLLERTRVLGVVRVEVHESDTDITGSSEHLAR